MWNISRMRPMFVLFEAVGVSSGVGVGVGARPGRRIFYWRRKTTRIIWVR